MKKILVVFYSRTDNTKRLGEEIANFLGAETESIIDKKSRKGIVGWVIGGKDAYQRKDTDIIFKKNPSKYDLVVIGTPVWAGTMAPAVRTYLKINKSKIKKVAFFCTFGGGEGRTFEEMKEIIGKKSVCVLGFKNKEIDKIKLKEFCEKLK